MITLGTKLFFPKIQVILEVVNFEVDFLWVGQEPDVRILCKVINLEQPHPTIKIGDSYTMSVNSATKMLTTSKMKILSMTSTS